MPSRWVGGKGSIASPTKDQYVEGRVLDEEGKDQGTIILKIKRIYAPGELGRFVLADLLSASDAYYRAWAESKVGKPSTEDGSYHFCRGDPSTCVAGKKEDLIVHVGKWRSWKEDELITSPPEGYDREAQAMLMRFFKKEGLVKGTGATAAPPLSILKKPTGGPKTKPGKPEDGHDKGTHKRLTELETELQELRKDVEETGPEKERAAKKGRKREPGHDGGTPRRKKTFEGGLLPMKKDKGGGGPEDSSDEDGTEDSGRSRDKMRESEGSVDWGGSSPASDEKDKGKKKSKEKKKARAGTDGSEEDKKGDKRKHKKPSKDEKTKKKKKKKKKGRRSPDKSGKRGKEKLERDKGPFGMGETRRMIKDDDEEESESGSETSGSSQSFRKAPSGLTLHLRLQRYAMKHPGRLATRLLQRMEKVCRLGGASGLTGKKESVVRPCALAYFLTILTPSLKDRWTPRTQRELRIWVEVLDRLAESESGQAADIVAQRIKALEQSVQDNNTWKKAKYLELVESDETTLADRGEVNMMQKEVELEEKFRGKGQWRPWEPPKGKGKTKDDHPKGGKGHPKGKRTPAQEAAEKKDQ